MIQVHWLLQKVVSPVLHRCHGFLHRPKRRQQDHRYRRIRLFRFVQNLQPGSPGHLQIGNDQQISPCAHLLNGRSAIRRFVHFIPRALQCLSQHRAQLILIFDKEERFHLSRFYHESRRGQGTTRDKCAEKGSSGISRSADALPRLPHQARGSTSAQSYVLEWKDFSKKLTTHNFILTTAPTPDRRPIFSVRLPCLRAPASAEQSPASSPRFSPFSH